MYPENQRFRQIMMELGYNQPHPFALEILSLKRSDTIQNVFNDKNRISTELLVLITNKVVKKTGEKLNGHWLLTGEGEMFLDNSQVSINTPNLAIQALREAYIKLEKKNEDDVKRLEKKVKSLREQRDKAHENARGLIEEKIKQEEDTRRLEAIIREREAEITRLKDELIECYKKKIPKYQ